jgi:predicted CoA-binding protein
MTHFRNPSSAEIAALLRRAHQIAVIGISADPSRPSHSVSQSMQHFGYRVVPINPALDAVLGEKCWPTLDAAVAAGIDVSIVDVFRQPQHVPAIVADCIRLKMPALWLQDGVIDAESASRAQDAGILTIMDRCIYRDRAALAAG